MKKKTSYVCFFKDSLNLRAVTPTMELNECNVSTFASLNMSAVAQKLNKSLKKQTQFSISFLQSKTTI